MQDWKSFVGHDEVADIVVDYGRTGGVDEGLSSGLSSIFEQDASTVDVDFVIDVVVTRVHDRFAIPIDMKIQYMDLAGGKIARFYELADDGMTNESAPTDNKHRSE
ncbi:MAG: hypothetical protein Q9180_005660 [Flavoplaca navasiana]